MLNLEDELQQLHEFIPDILDGINELFYPDDSLNSNFGAL